MTDPGMWTTKQMEERNIDLVLITHEHGDHLHVESFKEVMKNNPNAKVICNTSVGKILKEQNISFEVLENFDSINFKDILIEAVEGRHEEIWKEVGQVQNTGYFIDSKFFYPGDSFTVPKKQVEILGAPVAGPWNNMKMCIEYMLKVRPKYVIPVHDGMVDLVKLPMFHNLPFKICGENFIKFVDMKNDSEIEFE